MLIIHQNRSGFVNLDRVRWMDVIAAHVSVGYDIVVDYKEEGEWWQLGAYETSDRAQEVLGQIFMAYDRRDRTFIMPTT